MTHSDGPLEIIRAASRRLVGAFHSSGIESVREVLRSIGTKHESMLGTMRTLSDTARSMREVMRSFAEQQDSANEIKNVLAALPKLTQKQLTVITVRCPEGKLLMRVVRIPAHLAGAAYDGHLVIPTSATTYQVGDQRIAAFAWFLADHDETLGVRCRCHPEVGLTREQLLGGSPPPPGVRVLKS